MTDLRKAADMALEALEFSLPAIEDFGSKEQLTDCHRAIMALYKALAQPEQNAVAWMWKDGTFTTDPDYADGTWTPLFTAPPSKQWVGLTDNEIAESAEHMEAVDPTDSFWREFSQEIEAKLKEKNT